MNLTDKNSIKDEIYNSQIYRHSSTSVKRVVNGVVETVDNVVKEVDREFNGQRPPNHNHNANWQSPPPYKQNGQRPANNWSAPPPRQSAQQWQRPVQQQWQKPVAPVQNAAKEKPKKEKTEYNLNAIRWILIFSGFLVPLACLPDIGILVPICSALTGVGGIYLFNWIFKKRKKKEKLPHEDLFKEVKQDIKKAQTGNTELDKIINDGNEYIRKLKVSNGNIPHEQLSDSIDRMEKAAFDIFAYVKDNPEKIPQIKKFMNYYLPTTLKLLETYEKLSTQSVKGENILNTMHEIECMMYTVAGAFEKQLDSLFVQEAMDVGVDISVFDSILQQEGLKNNDETKIK